MIRISVLFVIVQIGIFSNGQERYFTRTGHIDFYSHAPLEDIRANNEQVAAFLYTKTGELSFGLLLKSFEFKKALMQKHFNENYIESDKYPKAVFKGKIENFNSVNLKENGKVEVNVTGQLIIRDQKKDIATKAILDIRENEIVATSTFITKPSDFNIKIPNAVKDNIGKEIEVNIRTVLKPD
jgi:hypothetical protein